MRIKLLGTVMLSLVLQSCLEKKEMSSIDPVDWEKRAISHTAKDSLSNGSTYLSVYSQIYSLSEHRTHNLTVTVSMRNTNSEDSLFINKASYFDTKGELIRNYFDHPIFIGPMETVEIVIDEIDKDGGTGANFLFDWSIRPKSTAPLFEGVMISTSGQQGLSFTTQGKRIK